MKKITVIGSLNMDLVTYTDRVPRMGETVRGLSFRTVCGGKGGNQAFAAARLGGRAELLGAVGADAFGQELLRNLRGQGVECGNVLVRADTPSGSASITVSGGDNAIVVIPGANGCVTPDYIKEKLPVLREASLILLELEIPAETVEYIIDLAKEEGIPVMLNPSPAAELPAELFKKLAYLIVNETECAFYTGLPVNTVEEAKAGLRKLRALGVPQVIVTLGSAGSVYNEGDEIFHMPAEKVTAVDSTAAGDTFTAGLLVGMLEGKSIHESVRFATRASAVTVTRMGAQSSIPSRDEL